VIAKRAFRALAHRNFRLFCVGQGISLVGTWAQQVAAAWLVYELTKILPEPGPAAPGTPVFVLPTGGK